MQEQELELQDMTMTTKKLFTTRRFLPPPSQSTILQIRTLEAVVLVVLLPAQVPIQNRQNRRQRRLTAKS